jgi:DNA-binding CsgD family transcriptional regulator
VNKTVIDLLTKQEWIDHMPGLFGVVDLQSKFLMMNKTALKAAGHKSSDFMLNTSYCDMRCKASQLHDNFCHSDKMVIKHNKSIGVFGHYKYQDKWRVLLGEKYPLRDVNGNIIAVAQYFTDVTNAGLIDLSRFFQTTQEQSVKIIEQQVDYLIQENYPESSISEKQSECLFFLLRGKSIKEIAKILNSSPRTIETHVDIIKYKLNCQNKSELIEKSIALGYMNIIPKNLLKKIF